MRTFQRTTTVGGFVDDSAEARFRTAYAEAMARLPEPTTTETIATRFGRVHVYRFGKYAGVPLVLLPGRNGCTSMWEPNLPTWAAHRTVYAVEVLGEAGLSVQEQPIRDTDDQAAWLGETLGDSVSARRIWSGCRSAAGSLPTWRCTTRGRWRRSA